jgi:hypothetical protein
MEAAKKFWQHSSGVGDYHMNVRGHGAKSIDLDFVSISDDRKGIEDELRHCRIRSQKEASMQNAASQEVRGALDDFSGLRHGDENKSELCANSKKHEIKRFSKCEGWRPPGGGVAAARWTADDKSNQAEILTLDLGRFHERFSTRILAHGSLRP